MINWNYLESFVVLSETLSFSETAKTLSSSQPVISRQIRLLEHDLGYPLFIRSTKRVSLTPRGLELKVRLGPLVEEIKRLLLEKQDAPKFMRGAIRIGSIAEAGQLLLAPRLAEFLDLHPQLQIHLSFLSSAQIFESVAQGALDLGFVRGTSDRKSVRVAPMTMDRAVLITEKRNANDWKKLSSYPFVGYRENDPFLKSFIDSQLSKTERRKVVFTSSVSAHESIIDLVCRQKAFAVIPSTSAEASVRRGEIEILLEDKKPYALNLITHESGLLDKKRRALVDFLVSPRWERNGEAARRTPTDRRSSP